MINYTLAFYSLGWIYLSITNNVAEQKCLYDTQTGYYYGMDVNISSTIKIQLKEQAEHVNIYKCLNGQYFEIVFDYRNVTEIVLNNYPYESFGMTSSIANVADIQIS